MADAVVDNNTCLSEHDIQNTRITIIGAGAMGSAIARGLVESHTFEGSQIRVFDHNQSKLDALAAYGISVSTELSAIAAEKQDAFIMAIKPQSFGGFFAELGECSGNASASRYFADSLVISIAAGITLKSLAQMFDMSRIIRAMPNLPVAVLSGATAMCFDVANATPTAQEQALAQLIFGALGQASFMREDQLDAEGAVVGCGPAYFALMIDALTRAGVRTGMKAQEARAMSIATMKGVALMLESGEIHPREFMEKVTSPGGTTAAALYALEPALTQGVDDGIDAALERTRELAGE